METIFISGMPCSGKSHMTTRLVAYLGPERAVRIPMDHYFRDAACPAHHDKSAMAVYQRDRIDWPLLLGHLNSLAQGTPIDTPRYDWNAMRRLPQDSGLGRSYHVTPRPLLFVDGMHPSLDLSHKHIFINPSSEIRNRLCQLRSSTMTVPGGYSGTLTAVETSAYMEALAWLGTHAWREVMDPLTLDIANFCRQCGWD